MASFTGISADTLFLLAENRFQDSKAFYEEHKSIINAGVVHPLRCLVSDLAPTMLTIDPLIVTDPLKNGCVSRVRRDNRYTHDKSMYRENMWIAFMRDKRANDWCVPAFYMDFSLNGAEWGMGFYSITPAIMNTLRGIAEERSQQVEAAIRKAKRAGFTLVGEPYARPRSTPETPAWLRPLYDYKGVSFHRREPADFVADESLVEKLKKGYKALAPFYTLFIEAVEMTK